MEAVLLQFVVTSTLKPLPHLVPKSLAKAMQQFQFAKNVTKNAESKIYEKLILTIILNRCSNKNSCITCA